MLAVFFTSIMLRQLRLQSSNSGIDLFTNKPLIVYGIVECL
ncbi:hypothetical protein BSBH6_01398 [Bacillus subtilis]|nr:hypothetical protein BSBH6_01398 [Bacillus subtilis]RPK18237.1 hypothetical protein BH5_01390 [Bacillus subtilis]